MDKNDLHDAAFGQWLKSRHLQKKHVFAGEEKRATDYSKHYNSVENTNQLNFDITQVNTVYNAQVGGYKQERDTIYYNSFIYLIYEDRINQKQTQMVANTMFSNGTVEKIVS